VVSNGLDFDLRLSPHERAERNLKQIRENLNAKPDYTHWARFDSWTVDQAMARIQAARRLFPAKRFNDAMCQGGLDALGWYHEKRDATRDIGLGPDHDWASHCSDAFGLMAVAYKRPSQHKHAIGFKVHRPRDRAKGC